MGLKCFFGHQWNDSCKCERCGEIRDERHNWVTLEGKCEEKCSICGEEQKVRRTEEGGMLKMSTILNPTEIKKVRVVLDLCFRHHGNPEVAASGGEILGKVAIDADLSKQDIARTGAMCDMIRESSSDYDDKIDLANIMIKLSSAMKTI